MDSCLSLIPILKMITIIKNTPPKHCDHKNNQYEDTSQSMSVYNWDNFSSLKCRQKVKHCFKWWFGSKLLRKKKIESKQFKQQLQNTKIYEWLQNTKIYEWLPNLFN